MIPAFCRQKCTNAAHQFCQADGKVPGNHFPPCYVAPLWSMHILSAASTLRRGTQQSRRILAIQRMGTQMYSYGGSLELNLNTNYTGWSLSKARPFTSSPSYSSFITWKPVCLGRKKYFWIILAKTIKTENCQESPRNGNDIHKKTGWIRARSGAVWSAAEPELVPCQDGNPTPFIQLSKLKLTSPSLPRVLGRQLQAHPSMGRGAPGPPHPLEPEPQ